MASVYDTVSSWARRTGSSFAELLSPRSQWADTNSTPGGAKIYRLRRWPVLPEALTTAAVLRTLSVMSHRPVSRNWILAHAGLPAKEVDSMLGWLQAQQAVEVLDPSSFS